MARNNRIFYATQAVLLRPQNSDGTSPYDNWLRPRGLQSVGITTNFTLEQVFQLGQIELYDNVENVPEVQVTLNKVLDGTMPLYLMCVGGDTGPISGGNNKDLAEIANNRVNVRFGVFSDTNTGASGAPVQYVDCSGMYLSSVSYTVPVDGNATEDITLVGNNKLWNVTNGLDVVSDWGFNSGGTPETSAGTARRYKFSAVNSVIPTGGTRGSIPNVSGYGDTVRGPYIQSITLSTDLGREAINELGRMAPYYRYVTFPVEVTSEFQVVAADGDQMEASDFSSSAGGCDATYKNLDNQAIKVVICGTGTGETLAIDLGDKNKLTSVNYTGGDTGGGNATVTYSYQNFNKFKVAVTGTQYTTENVVS